MRILLDSCVPRRLATELEAHEVWTAQAMGWGDLDDGPLLDAIADRFDILITLDKNLPRQQRLEGRAFSVVVLRAKSSRLNDLLPLVPALKEVLGDLRPGEAREIGG